MGSDTSYQEQIPDSRVIVKVKEIKGPEGHKKLGFRSLVIGSFTQKEVEGAVEKTKAVEKVKEAVSDKKCYLINKQNFNSVMTDIGVKFKKKIDKLDETVEFDLNELDDFEPTAIMNKIEETKTLVQSRQYLADLKSRIASDPNLLQEVTKYLKAINAAQDDVKLLLEQIKSDINDMLSDQSKQNLQDKETIDSLKTKILNILNTLEVQIKGLENDTIKKQIDTLKEKRNDLNTLSIKNDETLNVINEILQQTEIILKE
ncbi:MAG: type VI secretion system contractile sheath small subunit, partial [Desulfamplus sp.]|nr:type VI secretion system contractile sheath small subunit [Desulfamplus sp.]